MMGMLDNEGLFVRQAAKRSGIDHADFASIRHADPERFTIDRGMKILHRRHHRVQVAVGGLPMTEPVVAAASGAHLYAAA